MSGAAFSAGELQRSLQPGQFCRRADPGAGLRPLLSDEVGAAVADGLAMDGAEANLIRHKLLLVLPDE